jgi:hypothetical protein
MDHAIEKDEQKIRRLSEDEETLRMIELHEKHLSDTKTQINGTKREIAKKKLKRDPSISVSEVAELTDLTVEEVEELERQVR